METDTSSSIVENSSSAFSSTPAMMATTSSDSAPSTIVQVCNIAPQATRDMLYTLFSFVSKVEEIRLFPLARDAMMTSARTAFVRFADARAVSVCAHLNNTVFIDRAIIVNTFRGQVMPEEPEGLMLAQQQASGQGGLASKPLPPHVVSRIEGLAPHSVVQTDDANLAANGLPNYPPLPGGTDTEKVEEIRRTVCVVNVSPSVSAQECMDMFNSRAGEIKFFRFCNRPNDPVKYALIEFSEQPSVVKALMLNDQMLGESPIKVTHSLQAIVKPITKTNEAAQREIEEAMLKVKEAQSLVSAAVDPLMGMLGVSSKKSPSRGRSKSPRGRSRRGRRSRSRRRRSRSSHRSKHRKRSSSKNRKKRSRSRSRDKKRRSRSKDKKDSKSKDEKKDSKSKDEKKESRSKDDKKDSKKDDSSKSKQDSAKKVDGKKDENGTVKVKEAKTDESSVVEEGASKSNGVNEDKSSSRRRSRSSSRKRSSRRRSRSRDHKRHRSRSRKRKHRSRSKERDRKRSESRDRKKKSRKARSPSAEKNKETKKGIKEKIMDKVEESQPKGDYDHDNQPQSERASDDMEISNSP